MRELYEEIPCPHGEIREHVMGVLNRACHDGVRRRVNIDYESATALMNAELRHYNETFAFDEKQARAIIDAALVTEEGP